MSLLLKETWMGRGGKGRIREGISGGGGEKEKEGGKTKWRRSIGCRRRQRGEGNGQVTQLSSGLSCLKKRRWREEKKKRKDVDVLLRVKWKNVTERTGVQQAPRENGWRERMGVGGGTRRGLEGGTGGRRWREMSILEEGEERRKRERERDMSERDMSWDVSVFLRWKRFNQGSDQCGEPQRPATCLREPEGSRGTSWGFRCSDRCH